MDLSNFEPLFGEPKVESTPLRPFLFQVHAPDPSQLRVVVTDFVSTSFEALRSIQQLHDMRDETGVGGSWSDYLEYLVNSIKFGDVKLLLEGQSKSSGPRLIAQKSKGMPKISVSLRSLVATAANEAMASLSIDLYKAYTTNHKLLLEEQEGRHQLTKVLSAEKRFFRELHFTWRYTSTIFEMSSLWLKKSEQLQKQLDGLLYSNRHKSHKIHDKLTSDTSSAATLYDKQSNQNPSPMRAPKRVVPAHRRSKVRGVLLQDTEDD